jgi:hypothetical protein
MNPGEPVKAYRYTPDPDRRPHLLPLGADPHTAAPVHLDLDRYRHLVVAGATGAGTSSLLRLVAAHTAAHGAQVTVVDARGTDFDVLDGLPGIEMAVGFEREEFLRAVHAFERQMEERYRAFRAGADRTGPRRMLVIDGLRDLVHAALRDRHDAAALDLLPHVLAKGRAAGCHLVCDVDLPAMRRLGADLATAACVVAVGKCPRRLATALGIDPRLQRAHPGAAVLRTPGDTTGGRQVDLTFLSEDQARALLQSTATIPA